MRIWVYGDSPEWIRDMIKENISFDDTVTDTSISAEIGSSNRSINPVVICREDLVSEMLSNKSACSMMHLPFTYKVILST